MTPSPTPRIPPVPPDEQDQPITELLDAVGAGLAKANIFATLVRAPRLFRRWLPFGGALLSGRIPARDREILILRTGWNCQSPYEWAQHAVIGRAAGLSASEVVELARPVPSGFDEFDTTLVRAADELHATFSLTDDTWAALAARYDTEQLIEVPMLVGHYHLVAMTLNTLRVELDEGLEGFPDPAS
jgi:4-carboxymuconolactone decarboxylase